MEITQKKLNKFKSQIPTSKPLGKMLQDSLVVGGPIKGLPIKTVAGARTDYQEFSFNIRFLAIKGRIYKNGKLEFTGSVFGVKIGHTIIDLSGHEVCFHPGLGGLVSVKYCFYLKKKCLYTRGNIRGFWTRIASWNQKIFCF
ncbi:MAG: hypothetical protein ACYSSI_10460 [Planctomycetota bacterium]|jgi:hypothetical protein